MKMLETAFTVTDWAKLPAEELLGASGTAFTRKVEVGDLAIRMVEYSPGYLADHWCDRGHIIQVMEGEFDCELQDGRSYRLAAGMSCHVSDFGDVPHRAHSATGAKLFIVD
jgi:hypothetical protein